MSIINTKKVKLIVCKKKISVLVMIRIYWFCSKFLKGFGNKITIVYL